MTIVYAKPPRKRPPRGDQPATAQTNARRGGKQPPPEVPDEDTPQSVKDFFKRMVVPRGGG